jgi:hypothetical protein
MARRIVVTDVDDVDGSTAAETVTFGLDGVDYEIDLSARNAKRLRAALEPYRAAGRRTGGVSKRAVRTARPGSTRIDPQQLAAIRDWARRRGYEVSARGRVPQSVIDAYNAG